MADQIDLSGLSPVIPQESAPAPASVPNTQKVADNSEGLNLQGLAPVDQDAYNQSILDEKYGSLPQQALAGIEGAAQGIVGPLAPAAEIATGLTTGKDILGRATTNPFTHGASEALSFGASSIFGDELGLPGVVGEVGEAASKAIPKFLGAKGAAEMATIAASNEFSKMVEKDPNQTLGSAAVSVGLSGLLGGLGGEVLERYNPLKAYANNKLRSKASDAIQHIIGGGTSFGAGAIASTALGHPWLSPVAGYITERALEPIFTYLAKPLAQKIAGSAAAEAAYDYLYASNQGQKAISKTVTAMFTKAAESVQLKDMLPPSDKEREKLQSYLLKNDDIDQAMNMGNPIAHYMPDHATEAATLTANAVNYFKALKPTQSAMAPLDAVPPLDKDAQYKYNRALDVAEKPLSIIPHIEKGTLLPQDVKTIQTLYPGLHTAITKEITDNMIKHPEASKDFSYAKKQALNLFLGGNPLHSTMSQPVMQNIVMANAGNRSQQQMQQQGGARKGSTSNATLSQLNKVSSLYQTSLQARQVNRKEQ